MKTLPYILLLLLFAPARAQTPAAAQEDIKVGLVLSGGGAKGLAHVGAIKIIEQAGVRIDYIGGTSMGAVIGGLYASGYSGKQLDSILTAVDFDKLIQDYVPRNAKTFYEKNETDRYALTLPYDKFQLTLPSGFSKGQNFYNFLSKLTSHVSHVRDFDQLPIPFFCIATNAETGKEVLLEKGHLPKAIVASSALPTLFSPITINGTVMIDGGVVNNYPVDELRARGVDYIIGIDVQGSLKEKKQLVSAIAVLLQVNNYRTLEGMAAKRKRTDLYIHPDIKKFNVVGFDNALEIARAGEEKAGQYLKELEQIAKRQTARVPTGVPINTKPKIYIKRIEVEGNKNYTRSYIMGKLQIKAEDEIDHETFTRGVNNLTATGNFDEIDYRFVEETPGKHSLLLYVRESASKLFLRLGVHYDDLYRTAGLVNVTRKRLFTNNDIASLDLIVGDNLRYDLNYYIDKGFYWSVGFSSRFNFFDKDVPAQLVFPNMQAEAEVPTVFNRVNLEHSDVTNRLYVQTIFKRIFLLGAGVEHKWLQQLTKTVGTGMNSRPRTVFESTNYFSAYGYLKYDTYDNTFFPRQGVYFSGDFHLYLFAKGGNNDFHQFSIAKAKVGYATKLFPKLTGQFTTEGGFKIGSNNTRSLDFFVGGFGFNQINNIVPLYGYGALSLRGNTYLKSLLLLDYEVLSKNHINVFANIANVGDDLFESGEFINGVDYSGFGVGYGLETFLGPVQVKYSYSPERATGEWYVSAGFRF